MVSRFPEKIGSLYSADPEKNSVEDALERRLSHLIHSTVGVRIVIEKTMAGGGEDVLTQTFDFLNDYYSSSMGDSETWEGDLDSTGTESTLGSVESSRRISFPGDRPTFREEPMKIFARNSALRKSRFHPSTPVETQKAHNSEAFKTRLKSFETKPNLGDLDDTDEGSSSHVYEEIGTLRSEITSKDNEVNYQMVEFSLFDPKQTANPEPQHLYKRPTLLEEFQARFPHCYIKDEHKIKVSVPAPGIPSRPIEELYAKVKKRSTPPPKPERNQKVVKAELHPPPQSTDKSSGMNSDPDTYITVIPVEYQNQNNLNSGPGSGGNVNANQSGSQPPHHRSQVPRRSNGQKSGSSGGGHRKKNAKMRPDMDPDYREYFQQRAPRGEFLTRGAALASQQAEFTALNPPPNSLRGSMGGHLDPSSVVVTGSGPNAAVYSVGQRAILGNVGNNDGPVQPQHEQLEREPRRYVANHDLVRTRSGTKEVNRRNPTILRKKLDICIYLMSSVGIKMEVEDGASATVSELIQSLVDEEGLDFPRQTGDVLTLWMTSPLLDVQLKPHHKPFYIRREWNHFLQRFSSAPLAKKSLDEPIVSLQRNVFFPKRDEVKLRDNKILELLYEEAKYNILTGRYPCEISDYIMLGGIQARLELGPYDSDTHTSSFFRSIMYRFLPEHASICNSWSSLIPWRAGSRNSPENRLIEQFKAIPNNASAKRLVKKYLEFCWSLPYYGSAFFHGQIETPARSLTSLLINHDTEVLVAINSQGFYVIDPVNVVVLLGLKLEELSWDYAKPSQENNEDCLPCLFIQFCVIENGRRVSKILQIFSRQAVQMDALIATFVDELKQRVAMFNDDPDGNIYNDASSTEADDCLVPLTTVSRRAIPESCLSNKLNRLTLATFDDEGHCIGHMGSWSFSN
eukprot:maker-scaffold626_size122949-snap-gene-0.34 protein:Tk11483 transcript:maker-scaffold626_size122949-snap-gene-0.34-mRNA-1 annotation:"ferm domain-containing protein 8"